MADSLSSNTPTSRRTRAKGTKLSKQRGILCPCTYEDHSHKPFNCDKDGKHTMMAFPGSTMICNTCFRYVSHTEKYADEKENKGESDERVERFKFWRFYRTERGLCDPGVEDFLKWEQAHDIPLEYDSTTIPDECKATRNGKEFHRDYWVKHNAESKAIALCTAFPESYFVVRPKRNHSSTQVDSGDSEATWLEDVLDDPSQADSLRKRFKTSEVAESSAGPGPADTAQ